MKRATDVKSVWEILSSYFFTEYISLHMKFTAVVCLVEGQFQPAMENRVNFLIIWHGILRLILSIKGKKKFDPMKVWMKKGGQGDASWIMRYATLEAKVHKYSCKEYDKKKKQLRYRAADFCWMCSSQLALVVIMLLETDEAYPYLGVTGV